MANSKRKAHCGKQKHATLKAAQIALKRTVQSTNKKNPIVTDLSPYLCPYCGSWHIGRSQKKGINWDRVATFEKALKERCAEQRKKSAPGVTDNPADFYPADAGSIPAGRATDEPIAARL